MAAGNFHEKSVREEGTATATAHDATGTLDGDLDRLSWLPDDVLLDILGRLAADGDVRTVAGTSTLSRRWRHLPWPLVPAVRLDVGDFLPRSDEWTRTRRRRRRLAEQHDATAGLTDALARFLAAPRSERVVEWLSLKFILTRRDHARRIGDLVAAAAGAVRDVRLEVVTELDRLPAAADDKERTMLGHGERFGQFVRDCPGALRRVTELTVHAHWFHDPAVLNDVVRGCGALEHLAVVRCGFVEDDGKLHYDYAAPLVLAIDAPESRLRTLVCDGCRVDSVKLVQAPALAEFYYNCTSESRSWSPPFSLGHTPSLKSLDLQCRQFEYQHDEWRLSELLVNGHQIETLIFRFDSGKIWLQPETPKELGDALGRLKVLRLRNMPPKYDLSWTLSLLEAAPLLKTLEIHIFDHICLEKLRKKFSDSATLAWQPSSDFTHRNLKEVSIHRAFNAFKDLQFARHVMELAVNLETLTLGVKSLECEDCRAAEPKFADLARSRSRLRGNNEYVDAAVRKLKHGISTCAQITILLPD
ncbi:hypothetical protein ACP70R_021882 [Stipagrostis hirtigluma subsp. patula]